MTSVERRRKVGVNLSKVTKNKEKNVIWLQHAIFSFALMMIFAFHAKHSAFSKCFPKKGKE
jgi:small neutral amino acid transporter SnatA (MarC family)